MRKVLYVNITRFPIAVERVLSPNLRSRPLVIAPPQSGRAPVWESSDEARAAGVLPGMPMAHAKKVCKDLVALPPRPELYSRVAKDLEEKVVAKTTPLYEVEGHGRFFLDMTGFDHLYPHLPDKALDLQRSILDSFQLEGSFGGAANKLVSKVAAQTRETEHGIRFIKRGGERDFFAPLPVRVLPPIQKILKRSPGRKSSLCEELNIHTNRDIVELDPFYLQVAFGDDAFPILEMAKGVDLSPIQKSSRKEGHYEGLYLEEETNDLICIQKALLGLVSRGVLFLRGQGKYPGSLQLFIRYSDYKFVHKKKPLKELSLDMDILSDLAIDLLHQLIKRRTMIHYMALEFCELVQEEVQLQLFYETEEKKRDDLLDAMEDVRRRFGETSLVLGREF